MKNILWLITVICIVVWVLGFFGMAEGIATGSLIYILLIIAIIAILHTITSGRRPLN